MPKTTRFRKYKKMALELTGHWKTLCVKSAGQYASTLSGFLAYLDAIKGLDSTSINQSDLKDYMEIRIEGDEITNTANEYANLSGYLERRPELFYSDRIYKRYYEEFAAHDKKRIVSKACILDLRGGTHLPVRDKKFLYYLVMRGARLRMVFAGVHSVEYMSVSDDTGLEIVFMLFRHNKEKIYSTEVFRKFLICICSGDEPNVYCPVHNKVHEICHVNLNDDTNTLERDTCAVDIVSTRVTAISTYHARASYHSFRRTLVVILMTLLDEYLITGEVEEHFYHFILMVWGENLSWTPNYRETLLSNWGKAFSKNFHSYRNAEVMKPDIVMRTYLDKTFKFIRIIYDTNEKIFFFQDKAAVKWHQKRE